MKPDVYLFGQILGTHSFLLKDGFLQPDEYAEIKEQYFLPGGETGTAATVLDSLGVSVRMDGTWIGTAVAPMLKEFYREKKGNDALRRALPQKRCSVCDHRLPARLRPASLFRD